MSFQQVPATIWVKAINTATIEYLGSLKVRDSMELTYLVMTILKRGTSAGSEQFQLYIFPTSDTTKPALCSATVDLSATGVSNATSWLGTLRFDFSRIPLSSADTYHLGIKVNNYTRNADTFFLACVCDWPATIRDPKSVQMNLAGYK